MSLDILDLSYVIIIGRIQSLVTDLFINLIPLVTLLSSYHEVYCD